MSIEAEGTDEAHAHRSDEWTCEPSFEGAWPSCCSEESDCDMMSGWETHDSPIVEAEVDSHASVYVMLFPTCVEIAVDVSWKAPLGEHDLVPSVEKT